MPQQCGIGESACPVVQSRDGISGIGDSTIGHCRQFRYISSASQLGTKSLGISSIVRELLSPVETSLSGANLWSAFRSTMSL